jgi:hypothetical protein
MGEEEGKEEAAAEEGGREEEVKEEEGGWEEAGWEEEDWKEEEAMAVGQQRRARYRSTRREYRSGLTSGSCSYRASGCRHRGDQPPGCRR